MDAATRAELDALRRRAYAPSADIAADPAALQRLAELEVLALPPMPVEPSPPDPADQPPRVHEAAAEPDGAAEVAVLPASVGERRRRPVWHLALVAAVALVAGVLGAVASSSRPDVEPVAAPGQVPPTVREAFAFVRDPDAEVLMRVRINGSSGDYIEPPSAEDVPAFPANGPMNWVEPVGDYFGWKLWIGGATGALSDENCLVLEAEVTLRGKCLSTQLRSQGGLLLSVPYAEVAAEERPARMTAEQSLGFWWDPEGQVTILVSPTPAD